MVGVEERMEVLDECRAFLKAYLNGRKSRQKRSYPWKESWRFTVAHSLRVERYAAELIKAEGVKRKSDILLIRAAALMHDIGSLDDRKNHHKAGAAVVKKWCRENPRIKEAIDCKVLTSMILGHRKKNGREKKLTHAILKDADILDELGAMSIFALAHQVDSARYDYHARILHLLKKDEFSFLKKQQDRLTTPSAKRILRRKFAFIQEFARHLEEELKGIENLEL